MAAKGAYKQTVRQGHVLNFDSDSGESDADQPPTHSPSHPVQGRIEGIQNPFADPFFSDPEPASVPSPMDSNGKVRPLQQPAKDERGSNGGPRSRVSVQYPVGDGERVPAYDSGDDEDLRDFTGVEGTEVKAQSALAAVLATATSDASTRLQPRMPQQGGSGYRDQGQRVKALSPSGARKVMSSKDTTIDFSFVALALGSSQSNSQSSSQSRGLSNRQRAGLGTAPLPCAEPIRKGVANLSILKEIQARGECLRHQLYEQIENELFSNF